MSKKIEYKKKLTIKFFSIVFCFLNIYILLSSLIFGFIIKKDCNIQKNELEHKEINKKEDISRSNISKKTTFLILGMDQSDLLADVCIVGVFDRDTNNINLINIPRDTFVEVSEKTKAFILENKRKVPKTTKISNLYSYSGKKIGTEVLKKYLKDEFNINIDYYLLLYIDSFKKIVDILGPVTMEIPKGGFYYNDPVQKLTIKVPEGIQKLNGRLAEGVVRYRASYKRGDLQRIEMQQKFMMEFFKQTLSKENLARNIIPLTTTIIKNIETNFKIEELPKYLPYLLKLKEDNLIMQTLPGTHKMIKDNYSGANISYLICNKKEAKEIIDDLFFENNINKDNIKYYINEKENNLNNLKEIEKNIIDHFEYKIKILNGSNKINIEKKFKKNLEKEGFNFIDTESTYKGYKMANTRIITKSQNIGKELKKYFSTVIFVVDKDSFENNKENNKYDVLIVIGTLET